MNPTIALIALTVVVTFLGSSYYKETTRLNKIITILDINEKDVI